MNLPAPDAVLARHGRSFHFASRLLPRRMREQCARLYRFCRYADNLADEAACPLAAMQSLDAIDTSLARGQSDDPIVADFLALAKETSMEVQPARDLIAGMQADLGNVAIRSEAELIRYSYQVAGTVGLMMCAVLGARDARAGAFAIDLGIAMQLTNIARDVTEDACRDRRYLPGEWIGDMASRELVNPQPHQQPKLKAATARLLALADRYYASGTRGLAFLPRRARLGILIAARIYHAIGIVISRNDYAPWVGRAVVSDRRKFQLALRAVAEFVLDGRLHRLPHAHRASLHAALPRSVRSAVT